MLDIDKSTVDFLVASTFVWAPIPGLICAVIVIATGLPAYAFWAKRSRQLNALS